ncbi:MAG: hypothetical protein JWP81_4176 [Ferruginibacter sp.]|nr:hypothetical protein [Ferruginibacter sp.]
MKRFIFISLGLALTTGAMAQTAQKKAEIHKEKTEKQLKTAIIAKKDEKHEVGNDLKHANLGEAIKDRKEVRADRRIVHRKAKHLRKAHGVKHPIHTAQKEIRHDNDKP